MGALALCELVLPLFPQPPSCLLIGKTTLLISLIFDDKLVDGHPVILHSLELLSILNVLIETLLSLVLLPEYFLVFLLDSLFKLLELFLVAFELELLVGRREQTDDLRSVPTDVPLHFFNIVQWEIYLWTYRGCLWGFETGALWGE